MLKSLTTVLALATVAIFASGCGTGRAKVRVVHASPDATAVDVAVDGKTVITGLAFGEVSPASDYLTVTAGNRRIEVRPTGTSTDLIDSTVGFASGKQYTLLAVGKVNPPPPDPSTIAALLKTDDNSAPSPGNIKLRVIHAAGDGPAQLDIFVVAPNTDITNMVPTIPALNYQQMSNYLSVAAATYEVIMTDSADRTKVVFDHTYPLTTGQIRTLVTLDAGGGLLSALELSDLN